MLVVQILGGLGNQMFQYAFYKSLKKHGKEVKADAHVCRKYLRHHGYELDRVFGIQLDEITKRESKKYRESSDVLKEQRQFQVDPEIRNLQEGYLVGYWQNPGYFESIAKEMRSEFSEFKKIDRKNLKFLEELSGKNTVSLHVRRGDFVKKESAAKRHGGIATLQYYQNAIEYIDNRIEKPVFVVFSDDIKWCKLNLTLPETSLFVNWNKGKRSYRDMFLMSRCQHNIIANSSFSWWGAWLNENKNKIIVAPNKWVNEVPKAAYDICPNSWKKLPTT